MLTSSDDASSRLRPTDTGVMDVIDTFQAEGEAFCTAAKNRCCLAASNDAAVPGTRTVKAAM